MAFFLGFRGFVFSCHVYYAYIIYSDKHPNRRYVGFSTELKARLAAHNEGKNSSTCTGIPWKMSFYAAFETKEAARNFEEYLKTASGKAFARKRLHPGRH